MHRMTYPPQCNPSNQTTVLFSSERRGNKTTERTMDIYTYIYIYISQRGVFTVVVGLLCCVVLSVAYNQLPQDVHTLVHTDACVCLSYGVYKP